MSNGNLAKRIDGNFVSSGVTRSSEIASSALGYATSFIMTCFATAIAVGVDSSIAIPNLSLIFVVPVVIAGLSFGIGPSLFSAISGALYYNFFLTEPRYSLLVADAANIWAICLLFVVGAIVSGVAFTSQRRAGEANELRKKADILSAFSRDITGAADAKVLAQLTARTLSAMFRVPAVVILSSRDEAEHLEATGQIDLHESELQAARSAMTGEAPVRGGVYPDTASRFDFWPAKTDGSMHAVVGLAFDPDERPATPDTYVDVIRCLFGLALADCAAKRP